MGEAKRKKQFIYGWCRDMAKQYGAEVVDKDGKSWTWEAALIRAAYGTGEMYDIISASGVITSKMLRVAIRWENGEWPDWVQR